MHHQGAQLRRLFCQHRHAAVIQQVRQFTLAFGFIDGSVRCRIHNHIRFHLADGLSNAVQIGQVTAQFCIEVVNRHHLSQRRQRALKLPAHLAVLANQ